MKKLLFCLAAVGLLVLATPAWGTRADVVSPTVTGIDPAAAANDLDTAVTITGTGFATDLTGTIQPTASLGTTPLRDVTVVDATTITATVPWGIGPGIRDLTVTNPDGGTATLPAAFTVNAGIGTWNGSELYGGDVHQILMKPGDPDTLYAPAYGLLGLFRSTDAGESWTYTGGDLALGNNTIAVTPRHPDWLYALTYKGVQVSEDRGDSWNIVMASTWPDGKLIARGHVYPSPSESGLVFVSSYDDPAASGTADEAQGLIRSEDGGANWTIVSSLDGVRVVDVAFQPDDASRMTLVTQDAHVYDSSDAGQTWTLEAAKPALSSIGFEEELAYDPSVPGEVWILSNAPDGVFKSTDAALGGWTDVTPPYSRSTGITFTGAGSVWLTHWTSTNGGTDWEHIGPVSGNGSIIFDPGDSQVGYVGDGTYGVQKTTDGGKTWEVKDQGLTGMTCRSMAVSVADPLRVFAAFGNWPGVYRSADGAGTWDYQEISGGAVQLVRADPVDPQGVWAASDHILRSTSGGEIWSDLGWDTVPTAPSGMLFDLEADPYQPGHLLAALDTGDYLTGPGYLYASSDFGASWQPVAMPQALARITDIAYDPGTPGRVYMATGGAGNIQQGTGVYRSTDGGAYWRHVDDPDQPGMLNVQAVAIATHPRPTLFCDARDGEYRSLDGGDTWQKPATAKYSSHYLFAGGDSTRLYAADWSGLYFSLDAGDSWTRAAGAFGRLQITALGSADADGRTIIYAATNGGQAGTSAAAQAREGAVLRRAGTPAGATATASQMVGAGIYRYVVVQPKMTLKLSGLSGGSLRLGRRVTSKALVTPSALGGASVELKMQRWARKWVTVKTVTRTVGAGGACSWAYKPARKGSYRVRATMVKTATHMAATTTWRSFRVK